jgi:hypothetical protein
MVAALNTDQSKTISLQVFRQFLTLNEGEHQLSVLEAGKSTSGSKETVQNIKIFIVIMYYLHKYT